MIHKELVAWFDMIFMLYAPVFEFLELSFHLENGVQVWTWWEYLWLWFFSLSGPIFSLYPTWHIEFTNILIGLNAWVFILAVVMDALSLMYVSRYNQKNVVQKDVNNVMFLVLFLIWRLFLFDFYIFSLLMAKVCNMQMSYRKIIMLSISVHLLRFIVVWICIFLISYF